jgi:hypothetical protein
VDLLAKMLANITASQCMVVRMAQLQAAGKLTDAHAALAKAFTTAKCRETVAWVNMTQAPTGKAVSPGSSTPPAPSFPNITGAVARG